MSGPTAEPTAQQTPHTPDQDDVQIFPDIPTTATPANQEVFRLPPQFRNYAIVALIFLLLGIIIGGMMFRGSSVNETTLRLVLREMLAATNRNQSVDFADDDPYLGPADAPVVIVEFSDFLCPYCGRHFQDTLQPLLEHYDGYIRYVYRDFPGVGGEYAVQSALAAECANDQGQFWPYHGLLFEHQSALASPDLSSILIGFARDLRLDVDRFRTCLQTEEHIADILADASVAQQYGARGTPTFFINGIFVSGARPYSTFAAIIDEELRKAGINPDSL